MKHQSQNIKDLVPSRCWYYMLDWNEKDNWKCMNTLCGKTRSLDLTLQEFWQMFNWATQQDVKELLELSKTK